MGRYAPGQWYKIASEFEFTAQERAEVDAEQLRRDNVDYDYEIAHPRASEEDGSFIEGPMDLEPQHLYDLRLIWRDRLQVLRTAADARRTRFQLRFIPTVYNED